MGAINEIVSNIIPVLDAIYGGDEKEILMVTLEHDARELWPLLAVARLRNGYFCWPTPGRDEVAAELDGLPNRAARWLRIARAVGPREWIKSPVELWLRRAGVEIAPARRGYIDYGGGRGYTATTWEMRGDGFVATMETGRNCPPAFSWHGGPKPTPSEFVFTTWAEWRFE